MHVKVIIMVRVVIEVVPWFFLEYMFMKLL